MLLNKLEERPERELDWIFNPSAPLTEEDLIDFTKEATRVLNNTLDQLEAEGGQPC